MVATLQVWHELPDDSHDEVEALVVDKLRNQAGDDLRNVSIELTGLPEVVERSTFGCALGLANIR